MATRLAPLFVIACLLLAGPSVAAPDAPFKGSCLSPFPEIKSTDRGADPAFAGTFSCVEFYGEHVTPAMVKDACSGTFSPQRCPAANVLLQCRKDGKDGLILARYYAAVGYSALAKRFNMRLMAKGCPESWRR